MLSETFDPSVMKLYEGHLTEFLRKELRDKDVIVFFHERTRNWIVGVWVRVPGAKRVQEMLCIGPTLGDMTRDKVARLKYVFLGPSVSFRKKLREKEKDVLRKQIEENEEYEDALEWLAKRDGSYDEHPYFTEGKKA